MKASKAKIKLASSAEAVSTDGGQKQQSGKRTRVRAHLRAGTRIKQG